MTPECTCWGEQLRREAEETGFLKLVGTTPGYAEDGSYCVVHDPRKKEKSVNDQQSQLQEARRDRGEQLRALVVSWDEQKTFLLALNEQQREIEEGTFELNEDWCVMADEILGSYMSRPRMTAWDGEGEDPNKQPENPLQRPDCDSGPKSQ